MFIFEQINEKNAKKTIFHEKFRSKKLFWKKYHFSCNKWQSHKPFMKPVFLNLYFCRYFPRAANPPKCKLYL